MDKDEILREARERFRISSNAELENRMAALEDIAFTYNTGEGQWPPGVAKAREAANRPCLTINKLHKFVKQLVGEQRQNRPKVTVRPVDSKSDPAVARIYNDIIRHIEHNSNADVAYDTAYEYAVAGGFGYWRILTEWSEDDTFDQDIIIRRVFNPFTVYFDQAAQEQDYSDAKYCFVTEMLGRKDFEDQYPKNFSFADFEPRSIGEEFTQWFEPDKIRIAEYFYKEPVERTLALLETGETVELTPETKEYIAAYGIRIEQLRKKKSHKVMWCKITGKEVIEGPSEWPGKYIPVVAVLGEEICSHGKRVLRSIIRDAKDPQRIYNYWRTTATEIVALAPKQPYLVTPEHIQGHEAMWDNSHLEVYPYLLYNALGPSAPRREEPPAVPAGVITEANIANLDQRDTLGIYSASLGEPSNERSGRAILARQKESDTTTFSSIDNLRRAIMYSGKILVDLIPKIYNNKRVIRIRGEGEEGEKLVTINEEIINPLTGETLILNDTSVGKYDLVTDLGPSYASKRVETANSMIAFMQYFPQSAPFIADLVVKYMDWPGAEEFMERLKKLLPAPLQQEGVERTPQAGRSPRLLPDMPENVPPPDEDVFATLFR